MTSETIDYAVLTIDFGKGNDRVTYRFPYDQYSYLEKLDCQETLIAIQRLALKHSFDVITESGREEL